MGVKVCVCASVCVVSSWRMHHHPSSKWGQWGFELTGSICFSLKKSPTAPSNTSRLINAVFFLLQKHTTDHKNKKNHHHWLFLRVIQPVLCLFFKSCFLLLKQNSRNSKVHWNTAGRKESSSAEPAEIPQLCQKNKTTALQHTRNCKWSRHSDKKTTPPVNATEAAVLWRPFRRPIKTGPWLKFASNCCRWGSNKGREETGTLWKRATALKNDCKRERASRWFSSEQKVASDQLKQPSRRSQDCKTGVTWGKMTKFVLFYLSWFSAN